MYPGEDNEYFSWLCSKITTRREMRNHGLLLYRLYSTEFIAKLGSDRNRISDVNDLREEYEEDIGYCYSDIPDYECSILELIWVISDRIINIMGDYDSSPANWFWVLLGNLVGDIDYFSNRNLEKSGRKSEELDEILSNFVNRRYNFDGSGGIFPLKYSEKDQKRVEIWYQMQAYLNEIYPD